MAMENNQQNDVNEIDLLELVGYYLRHWYLFLVTMLLTLAAGLYICKFVVKPQYESTTKIIILNQQNNGSLTYSDMQLASQLTKDYQELIKSRDVLETVIRNCGLNDNYSTLLSRINVANVTDTRILSITVTDPSPQMAQVIANNIRETASDHIRGVTDVEAVNMVENANLPTEPASPSVKKWAVVSAAIGILIMLVILSIRFLTDDSIKTADDIEKYLGLSTLAVIPKMTATANAVSSSKKKATSKSSGTKSSSSSKSGSAGKTASASSEKSK